MRFSDSDCLLILYQVRSLEVGDEIIEKQSNEITGLMAAHLVLLADIPAIVRNWMSITCLGMEELS